MMYIRTQSRAFDLPMSAAQRDRSSSVLASGAGRPRQFRRSLAPLKVAMADPLRHRCRGMGDAATTAQYTQIGGTLAAPVISGAAAASAASSIAAGGSGLILGMAPALAIPVIGAAIAGVTILATVLIKNSGCGQTCIETSQWANQAEPLLKQNADAYFSNPAPRSQSQQNAALANFDAIWARLDQMCSDPSTGDAGKRCISDRQAGACKWTATVDSPWPGGPKQGQCWNWQNAYRDPIAQDPNVVPDSASSILGTAVTAAEGLPSWVWLAVLAVLAVSL